MRTDPSPSRLRDVATWLALDGCASDVDLQRAVWKARYDRSAEYIDQRHAALAGRESCNRRPTWRCLWTHFWRDALAI